MIKVTVIRHYIHPNVYTEDVSYYMDMSETELYNYFVDKFGADIFKSWDCGRLVFSKLSELNSVEIILEVRKIKPINFNELVDRVGVQRW